MTPDDIQPFCERDKSTRYSGILRPFRIGKWLYATDNRILVRIPASGEALSKGKVPKADELFAKFRPARCTNPWPKWNGEGRRKRPEDDDYRITINQQSIAGRSIGGLYWLMVSMLGSVQYYAARDTGKPIHFVCGELQGLLMPRKRGLT